MAGTSSLLPRIDAELIAARKRRDELTLSALGLLKSEIVKASKEPGQGGGVDDTLVIRVIRREVKRRDEAADAFRAGGREEQAGRELEEARLLREYLPAGLSAADQCQLSWAPGSPRDPYSARRPPCTRASL